MSLLAHVGWMPQVFAAEGTIKVGILHSCRAWPSPETSLKDVALMTIDEINAQRRHVMGKSWKPWWTPRRTGRCLPKSRQLLSQDKVAVVFGCWTSVSRKSVLPVFKELNGLLFYPVQYEAKAGRTCSTPAPRPTSKRSRPWNT